MINQLEPVYFIGISDDVQQAEFRVATYEAIENNLVEFEFQGWIVDTIEAVAASQDMLAQHTYH